MTPTYTYIFKIAPNLKILIYSGDVDIATVPHADTQQCVFGFNRPLLRTWRPWILNGATAGFVEVYDKFTYATVKGAGHEVPTYQPYSAYYLFSHFLKGLPL